MSCGRVYGRGCSVILAAFFALFPLTFAACSSSEVERAFGPGAKPEESGKVIVKYCVSCHQHKDFSVPAHNGFLTQKYPAEFGKSSECRGCHTYEKNWLFDVKRGTHRMKGDG